ncbi:MAG: sigma 54-interacting transcriptional regulator, partial [Firmicutes bacterium]|nr:sigma 54-interacting transcriptional regulator [Bacillota bacterium]
MRVGAGTGKGKGPVRRAGEATSSGREEIFRVVLECLEEGIHVVDADGVTVFYNRAAAAIDNLNPSEVVGRPLLEVFPSLTVETSTLLRVLQSGQPETDRQQAFTNFKGDEITTVNSTYPIWGEAEDRGGGGRRRRLLGAVEVARDITRLKDLSERMLVLQRQLAGASSGRTGAPDEQEAPSAAGAVYTFEDIIGEGPAMRALKSLAAKAAQRHCPILVWGETGSGKELLVQAIHNAGPRRHRPFVAQNCAALPEPLLEGILFGTQKGGFTGAVDRPGLIELADGGTLFLDEIDSLQLNLQAKLLRVIQDRMVRRVGGTASRKVDVRFMAACGGDPQQAVAEGRLRADLFYRLNVVGLHVPPLR